jgi:hypothetical protein
MVRRFTSIFVIVVALMSFFVSSTLAQDENIHRKKTAKREHVIKKKAHKEKKQSKSVSSKRHRVSKKSHSAGKKGPRMKKKVKEEKEDSRIKVN